MAERHPREETLRRVHGTGALFAAAYGNVGSSIYYALGLVASFALGLTPIVFIIAGGIFYLTAATYAEATSMYPEAGGSSSFARHAFNELVSFGAAWAQMLNYVITIAISVIFVPHYLSIFWSPLRTNPWDIVVGIASRNAVQLGATPRCTLCHRIVGWKIRTNPRSTSKSCVAKSTTARKMFSLAASWMPTMLMPTSTHVKATPTTMSHGFVRSGDQKIER